MKTRPATLADVEARRPLVFRHDIDAGRNAHDPGQNYCLDPAPPHSESGVCIFIHDGPVSWDLGWFRVAA